MQKQGREWKPIAYASRSMTEMEQRCAQIEKEAMATWACEKFSTYILGMKFMIETHHKPLVPLLGSKQLDNFPQESYGSGYAWQDSTTISTMYQETFLHC